METCLNAVEASYKKNDPPCIRDLSFRVADTGVTALVGESGSGKTSILRLFAGFLRPTAGSVFINGNRVASASPDTFVRPEERKVGVLFQDYALFPHLNVAENILFGVPGRTSRSRKQEILHDLLEAFHLKHLNLTNRRPHELSGGQMQRVALARVLASRPNLLILDEPFSSVDLEPRERILGHVKQLVEQYQMRLLYITHDRNEAFRIADRLAIIRQGQLLQQGTAQELYRQPVNAHVARYFDKANILPLLRLAAVPGNRSWNSPIGIIEPTEPVRPTTSGPTPAGPTERKGSTGLPGKQELAETNQTVERLCLRPHELVFCRENEGGPARVVGQYYYGSYSETHCLSLSPEFDSVPLIVHNSGPISLRANHNEGDLVRIGPAPGSQPFHIFTETAP
ncbi:ABC transporter ATP-binding protein [Candidatus Haliotispira prima]|uniref:ABC transporter ATP-binding protein n=1 Tax=Candidatus Haliotispira prima TaxID=3034016 RepID=A0ABY8MH65_9SPIO|nr:ABC transporter ATP-binding protein [Candidatus Haliotispira prima]